MKRFAPLVGLLMLLACLVLCRTPVSADPFLIEVTDLGFEAPDAVIVSVHDNNDVCLIGCEPFILNVRDPEAGEAQACLNAPLPTFCALSTCGERYCCGCFTSHFVGDCTPCYTFTFTCLDSGCIVPVTVPAAGVVDQGVPLLDGGQGGGFFVTIVPATAGAPEVDTQAMALPLFAILGVLLVVADRRSRLVPRPTQR